MRVFSIHTTGTQENWYDFYFNNWKQRWEKSFTYKEDNAVTRSEPNSKRMLEVSMKPESIDGQHKSQRTLVYTGSSSPL